MTRSLSALLPRLTPQRYRTSTLGVITLITTVSTAGLLTLYSAKVRANADKTETAKASLAVTTVKPASSMIAANFGASGSISAWQEAIIGAEVNGLRISEIRVNVGDVVRKGQVLAMFADESVDAELAQSLALVSEAEATLAEAQVNAERAKTLQASGALSVQQINQYTTAAKTAEARLASARANARINQIRFSNTRVVAPDDGTISARIATLGAVIQSGQELFRMVRKNRLEWRAEVTASELANIAVGQKVRVFTPSGETVDGKVRMMAPTADPQTRNVQVFVDLAASKTAKAGLFARGEFELSSSIGMTVPQQAIVSRDGFSYAFTVGTDNRARQVKVVTGRRVGDRIEIKSGVNEQSAIVATGAGFLKDGDLVKLVTSMATSPKPASPKE